MRSCLASSTTRVPTSWPIQWRRRELQGWMSRSCLDRHYALIARVSGVQSNQLLSSPEPSSIDSMRVAHLLGWMDSNEQRLRLLSSFYFFISCIDLPHDVLFHSPLSRSDSPSAVVRTRLQTTVHAAGRVPGCRIATEASLGTRRPILECQGTASQVL